MKDTTTKVAASTSSAAPAHDHLYKIRHSLAHLLAAAVNELYPGTQNTIGPAIDNGFYYDFDFTKATSRNNPEGAVLPAVISENDFKAIEKKMRSLLTSWHDFAHQTLTEAEATKMFAYNPYKLELIAEIVKKGEPITVYTSGTAPHTFTDLCRGGHVDDTAKEIKPDSFKLHRIAGAYWRGSEENAMLTRIYGLAFETKQALDEYETMMVEAEKRDHRKLGKELDIFTFDEDVGPGLPLWMPNGAAIIEELEKLAKETEFSGGYERVRTPHIAKESMYLTSGHLPYYEDSMYPPMIYEEEKYYLRAMNCPHHHKIFAARPKSYRDLPLRLAEHGTVYRQEKSGELFGIMRVRAMCQNDAHIYCTEAQFADEFRAVNDMYINYFKIFGIDKYVMRFSTHDPAKLGKKYVNEPELWKKTEDMVRNVLIESKIPYVEIPDEGAFYGPKIDVQVWSAIGREFTLSTNQVDFAVPARFGLTYTDSDGTAKTPLCIHRAPLGTHERFIGFLIEHYGGNFPLWLAPTQVVIVPIGDAHHKAATLLYDEFRALGIRAKMDLEDTSFGKKIRAAKTSRAPYFVIIGDKDIEAKKVTLESRDHGQIGQIGADELVKKIVEEVKMRRG